MKEIAAYSLEEAKKRIAHWRATRTKRRPIPDQVWDAVLPLISRYSYSTISSELGLSYQQIKNKLAARTKTPSSQQNAFISVRLPQETLHEERSGNGCKVALTNPNGLSLVIDGAPQCLINEIVADFVGRSC
jgi:hypothetical protein